MSKSSGVISKLLSVDEYSDNFYPAYELGIRHSSVCCR